MKLPELEERKHTNEFVLKGLEKLISQLRTESFSSLPGEAPDETGPNSQSRTLHSQYYFAAR